MPMASELKSMHNPKFLVYGKAGSGKTTLFRTIPGRKFLYMFDPAGLNSISSTDDIFYEQFLIDTVPMSVNTLKGVKDSQSPSYQKMETYVRWENDFSNRIDKGWFTDPTVEIDGVKGGFDAIGFDSLTTLTDLVMDRILELNQRAGKNPELGDYGILANTISRIIRNATSLDIPVYLTAHEAATQDKLMRTISYEIMVPGQLKSKLPLLFSEIYHATATVDGKGKQVYQIATAADDTYALARCSNVIREAGMQLFQDVTIANLSDPTKSGLGPILKKLRGQ
jgi:GTPase SAR1 family protein